jgi:Na+-driven multidrug efflux pump
MKISRSLIVTFIISLVLIALSSHIWLQIRDEITAFLNIDKSSLILNLTSLYLIMLAIALPSAMLAYFTFTKSNMMKTL